MNIDGYSPFDIYLSRNIDIAVASTKSHLPKANLDLV